MDVFFRNPNCPKVIKNQAKELEYAIKILTDENFEYCEESKYKSRLTHPENFEIIERYPKDYDNDDVLSRASTMTNDDENYICLCSENTCTYLMIVRHIPTNNYIALGSTCYLRFDPENTTDIYYKCKAKRCKDCKDPLVHKVCKYTKNTNKKCDGFCFGCVEKTRKEKEERDEREREQSKKEREEKDRVYLNVSYDEKDDAKSMGAWWDPVKRKWFARNNKIQYQALIKKYS